MNKVILLGRLAHTPECRYTNNDKVVTSFSLAVDRPFTNAEGKREADFFNCQIWGKSAERLANSVNKGERVLVEGRAQNREYTAKDGSKKRVTEIICDRFEYIERKTDGQAGNNSGGSAQTQQGGFASMGSSVPFDEEIPF